MTTIGLICAIPQESKPIIRRFPGAAKLKLADYPAWAFKAGDNRVILVESGMGPANAEAATTALITFARPQMVLNTGFCGAIRPGIAVGDLVLAREQYSFTSGKLSRELPPDSTLTGTMGHELKAEACFPGVFISTASFANKIGISTFIPDNMNNPVLEMESMAVIRRCRQACIPVAALRVVSDSGDEDPAPLVSELFNPDFTLSRIRAVTILFRKPGLLPQLLNLAANSKKAGHALANALVRTLEKLG